MMNFVKYLSWSPDGKKITYVDGKENAFKIVSLKEKEIGKIIPKS